MRKRGAGRGGRETAATCAPLSILIELELHARFRNWLALGIAELGDVIVLEAFCSGVPNAQRTVEEYQGRGRKGQEGAGRDGKGQEGATGAR